MGSLSMLRCALEFSPPCNRRRRHRGAEKAGDREHDRGLAGSLPAQEARTVILGGERGLGTASIWSECSGLGMCAFLA